MAVADIELVKPAASVNKNEACSSRRSGRQPELAKLKLVWTIADSSLGMSIGHVQYISDADVFQFTIAFRGVH